MWSKQNIVMGDETNESWKWTECIHECEHSNVRTIFTHDELLSSTIDIYAMRWITFMIYLTCYTIRYEWITILETWSFYIISLTSSRKPYQISSSFRKIWHFWECYYSHAQAHEPEFCLPSTRKLRKNGLSCMSFDSKRFKLFEIRFNFQILN